MCIRDSNTPASVMNYGKIALTGSSLVRSFYLLENLQGKVPSITSQTQRNRSNAPARASYIHIEGQSSGKKLEDVYKRQRSYLSFHRVEPIQGTSADDFQFFLITHIQETYLYAYCPNLLIEQYGFPSMKEEMCIRDRFLHMPWHHKSHVPGMSVLGSNFAYR